MIIKEQKERNPYHLLTEKVKSQIDGFELLDLKEEMQILDTNKIIVNSKNYNENDVNLLAYSDDNFIIGNIVISLPKHKIKDLKFNEFKKELLEISTNLEEKYYENIMKNKVTPNFKKIIFGSEYYGINENSNLEKMLRNTIANESKSDNYPDIINNNLKSDKIEKQFQNHLDNAALLLMKSYQQTNEKNELINLLITFAHFSSQKAFDEILTILENDSNHRPFYNVQNTFIKIKKAKQYDLINNNYERIKNILSKKLDTNALIDKEKKMSFL